MDRNTSVPETLLGIALSFGLKVDVVRRGNAALRMLADAEHKTLQYIEGKAFFYDPGVCFLAPVNYRGSP